MSDFVNNPKNKVSDLYLEYKQGNITLKDLEIQIKKRCINNLHNWYHPEVVRSTRLENHVEQSIIKDLIAHNKSMAVWLYDCIKYCQDDREKMEINARINIYKQTVYKQQERLMVLKQETK
jgi:copper homeostasis protein CutC